MGINGENQNSIINNVFKQRLDKYGKIINNVTYNEKGIKK